MTTKPTYSANKLFPDVPKKLTLYLSNDGFNRCPCDDPQINLQVARALEVSLNTETEHPGRFVPNNMQFLSQANLYAL